MNQPFIQTRQGTGGPNAGAGGRPPAANQQNPRGGPPPPPPPPFQTNQGMARSAMNQYHAPPQPNMGASQYRDAGPMRAQPRSVEISDIRLERMTEDQIREMLSQYLLCRFEKVVGETRRDLDGRKIKSDWTNVTRTWASDVDQVELSNAVRRLNRDTRRVTDKKRSLSLPEQRQVEKALEDLAASERDPQYQTVLVQLDHLLSNGESHSHPRSKSHSRSHSRHAKYGRVRSKSGSRKKHNKKPKRIALLAYYKRCPKPDVNAFALRDQHDFQTHVLPQQQQHFHAQQQHLQHQQHQLNQQQHEFRQQQHHFHHQQQQQQYQNQRARSTSRPAPGGRSGNGGPAQGGPGRGGPIRGGPVRAQVVSDSESDSDDSRSSASSMWSDDNSESTKRTESSTSARGPRVIKKIGPSRSPPRPEYYGVKPRKDL